ncbi:phage integrase N-terminal domain-containing protein [Salibacterium salarium]|nr:phage integrase N-terminal domain-containing protein [Salibacterium salarium]
MSGRSPIQNQAEKIFRHTRSNSFGTRSRYQSSCRKFIEHLDDHFKMKNLRNIQDKHLVSYIKHRQSQGVAPKTIKNDIGAIKYMHDLIPRAKHALSNNDELKKGFSISLEQTPAVKGDRAWTQQEYESMQKRTSEIIQKGEKGAETARDARDVMKICRTMGLRVTEAVAVSRAQAEKAVRSGIYQVKNEAKNGKWRKVPLSQEGKEVFIERFPKTSRGQRFFIRQEEKTHEAVNRLEKFMSNHCSKLETPEGVEKRTWRKSDKTYTNSLTFHGLRYGYVQDRVQEEVNQGFSLEQAAMRVTQEVGHERGKVILVYLGGRTP